MRHNPAPTDLKACFADLVAKVVRKLGYRQPVPDDLQESRTMIENLVDYWKEEWRAEGKAKGEAKGAAIVLLKLLRQKFGHVSPEIEQRVTTAALDDLMVWTEAILDAGTLDDVFRSG